MHCELTKSDHHSVPVLKVITVELLWKTELIEKANVGLLLCHALACLCYGK